MYSLNVSLDANSSDFKNWNNHVNMRCNHAVLYQHSLFSWHFISTICCLPGVHSSWKRPASRSQFLVGWGQWSWGQRRSSSGHV